MYAIVKTGGKQYRVSEGQSLLVERLPGASEGSSVELEPLLFVDGSDVVDGEGLASVTVSARVVAHERTWSSVRHYALAALGETQLELGRHALARQSFDEALASVGPASRA